MDGEENFTSWLKKEAEDGWTGMQFQDAATKRHRHSLYRSSVWLPMHAALSRESELPLAGPGKPKRYLPG